MSYQASRHMMMKKRVGLILLFYRPLIHPYVSAFVVRHPCWFHCARQTRSLLVRALSFPFSFPRSGQIVLVLRALRDHRSTVGPQRAQRTVWPLPISLFRNEFQEVLFRQEAVLVLKLISRVSHFLDDAVPRNEMVFREAEFAGSFIGVKVDDGDVRAWL